ncbi:protein phosphatase inhibitor 3, putative [Plasmodium yoelii]|uniref:Protein phosphatase inhibitor 3, putative n=1 Tax=Plasmodium yoelii TaxID=5861 RepID=A0A078K7V3_PLAYE|nr:protein phosphatase inhibitor 3, putative [Plasmodium yoelii]CDU16755.1 protein phosphatase inhibitor 3, putative [Plasmodium yoelii]VTZ74336.1 protein phosphatase inhibitor 3, putative [Plasmodium yoelii]|eukprot:XP_022811684.1 protein phosphatase inhibitor 3, putative [Plasmodium yoelii]
MSHGHSTITCLQDPSSRTGRDGNTRDIVRFVKLAPQKKVTWDKNTIDNEHANKKSSKACCKYKKPKRFDESSESESSDSDFEGNNKKSCKKPGEGGCSDCSKRLSIKTEIIHQRH